MIREDGYRALRQTETSSKKPLFDKFTVLDKVTVEVFTIDDSSPVTGKSIEELKFRTMTGATIIAIEQEDRMNASPDPTYRFKTGDIVFITGKRTDINKALLYLMEGEIAQT